MMNGTTTGRVQQDRRRQVSLFIPRRPPYLTTPPPPRAAGDGRNQRQRRRRRQILNNASMSDTRETSDPIVPEASPKECLICAETKSVIEFPDAPTSETTMHPPDTCLACIQAAIKTDLETFRWNELRCVECSVHLDVTAVAKYADEDTFARYEGQMFSTTVQEIPGFTWCPLEGCESGQINLPGKNCSDDGLHSAVCHGCNGVYCLSHNMAWHQGLTCEEYDIVCADPSQAKDLVEYERLQAKMDPIQLKEIQVRAEDRRQEKLSEQLIKKDTKPCPLPGCNWYIEKNGGCNHMTCSMCKGDFCWDRGALYGEDVDSPMGVTHKESCPHYRPRVDWDSVHVAQAMDIEDMMHNPELRTMTLVTSPFARLARSMRPGDLDELMRIRSYAQGRAALE